MEPAFALWITGLPASGKSTLAKAVAEPLWTQGIRIAILESDALRRIFTPNARYDREERDRFYASLISLGRLLTLQGIPVIFDATANLRLYRAAARQVIPRLLEVYVDTPLEVCQARDPKGLYRRAHEGSAATVPGLQVAYEPPERPDLTVLGNREAPEAAARRVVAALREKGWI